MIPENMVTVRSPLLVPMITVAKVVTEHLLSFCMMAHLLHSPKLPLMGLTLALHTLQHGYSVQDTTTHAHVITHSSLIHLCYSAYLFNHHSKFQVLNMLSTAGMLITYHGYHLHMLTNMFDVVWFTL